MPKDKEYCACLSIILLDCFLLIQTKNIILKYKDSIKDRKIVNTINEDLEFSESDDESDE